MTRRAQAWAVLVGLSLALHLRAAYAGPAWQVHLFKPLTTTLLIVMAAVAWRRASDPQVSRYGRLLCAGLVCSVAGDILLLAPGRFLAGLAAFLLAHLWYIVAFAAGDGLRASRTLTTAFAAYLAGLLTLLLPYARPLALPVIVYGLVVSAMAWQAAERWRRSPSRATASAAAGAALFLLSDSALALHRFVTPFRLSVAVVMTTYIAGQWLIARSIELHPPGRAATRRDDVLATRP